MKWSWRAKEIKMKRAALKNTHTPFKGSNSYFKTHLNPRCVWSFKTSIWWSQQMIIVNISRFYLYSVHKMGNHKFQITESTEVHVRLFFALHSLLFVASYSTFKLNKIAEFAFVLQVVRFIKCKHADSLQQRHINIIKWLLPLSANEPFNHDATNHFSFSNVNIFI